MNWKNRILRSGALCGCIMVAGLSPANEDRVVVYAPDDTIQCQSKPTPRPVENDAKALKERGASKICAQGKVPGPYMYALKCDLPTGQVNAFLIEKSDWETIKSSYVGPIPFREWPNSKTPTLTATDECEGESKVQSVEEHEGETSSTGIALEGLIGRPLRCYTTGDVLTDDYISDRVNIEKNKSGKIVQIWFG